MEEKPSIVTRLFDYGDEPEYDEVDESELQQTRSTGGLVDDCKLQNKSRRSQKNDVNQFSPHSLDSGIQQAISSSAVSGAGNDSPPTPSLAVQTTNTKHKVSLKKSTTTAASAKKILITSKSAKSKTSSTKAAKGSKISRLPILASVPGALRPSPEEVRAAASNTSSSPLISVENVTVIGSKGKKNPVSNSSNSDAVHGATMTGDSNMTSDANNISERASIVPILSTVAANSLGERGSGGGGGQDVSGIRRQQQQQVSSSSSGESIKHFHYLTLTVRKDENGYGMKVSGDNPVFVESVKPGGAAQIAGLVAGDMILKVNGNEVRSEKHPTVVSLIKASTIVELAVKRSHKFMRPTSIDVVPSTPVLSDRKDRTASITGPQPVDSIKRREMETYKINTLQKMLEQETLNMERLKDDPNNPSYKLSEANIKKLREQLRQVGVEQVHRYSSASSVSLVAGGGSTSIANPNVSSNNTSSSSNQHNIIHQYNTPVTAIQPQQSIASSPAFLSLLPRSLSALSLGGRKNKADKDLITASFNNTMEMSHCPTSPVSSAGVDLQSHGYRNSTHNFLHQQQQSRPPHSQSHQHLKQLGGTVLVQGKGGTPSPGKNKSKHLAKSGSFIEEDVPPPLPQRNQPRQQFLQVDSSNHHSHDNNNNNNNDTNNNSNCNDANNGSKMATGGGGQPNANNSLVSDLDYAVVVAAQPSSIGGSNGQSPMLLSSNDGKVKQQRSKVKAKALSDPKMSTHIFLQMENAANNNSHDNNTHHHGSESLDSTDTSVPPPLPPRLPGMLEESSHKGSSCHNLNTSPLKHSNLPANSIDNLMQYPLVATCTPLQHDGMAAAAAFPLSQRPNIVQQLQNHQQQQHLHGGGGGKPVVTLANANISPHTPTIVCTGKHRRVITSPDVVSPRQLERQNKTNSGSWELLEKDDETTPPGTPPPPYRHSSTTPHLSAGLLGYEDAAIQEHNTPEAMGVHTLGPPHWNNSVVVTSTPPPPLPPPHCNRIQAAQATTTQKEIISMEDEDTSDQDESFIDENGPFNSLQRLLENENVTFLAVFLNYVLSNSEPAPLLFYLITGLYKEGTAKDMRKWVYEIHSTFLVPRAPLVWYRQDELLAREVDSVLQNEFDKVEILRKIFWKSRKKARDIICEQLREFQQKRTAGLGTIYGPTDAQLLEAKGDKQREQYIFEETLMKKLQILIDEYEKDLPLEDPKKLALCSALSTVIHRIFITRSHPNSILDRVHHFVSREKSFKSRLMSKKGKIIVRGHPFVSKQYYEVTNCNHCQTIIWGVSPQGFHCTDCKWNIHRHCSKVLEENCPGPLPQSKRKDKEFHNDNKISKLMGKIRPRTSTDIGALEKRVRQEEDVDFMDFSNERLNTSGIQRQPSDRRPDVAVNLLSHRSKANVSLHTPLAANAASDLLQNSFHGSDVSGTTSAIMSGLATPTPSQLNGVMTGGSCPGLECPAGNNHNSFMSSPCSNNGSSGAGGGANTSSLEARINQQHSGTLDVHHQCDLSVLDSSGAKNMKYDHSNLPNNSTNVVTTVNRSESYKECASHKRNRSLRKTSDPSLTSRPHDEQHEVCLSATRFPESSNSSLSSGGDGYESPCMVGDQLMSGGGITNAMSAITSCQPNAVHHPVQHLHLAAHGHQDSFQGSTGSGGSGSSFWTNASVNGSGLPLTQRQWDFEIEDDDDLNDADWSSNVPADVLTSLSDTEKKRQEIINEIYQTERNHVRTLKLLDWLFYAPLQESGILLAEHLQLLFPPSMRSLCELHSNFEQMLRLRRLDHNYVVQSVGDLLVSVFDGKPGDNLREFAVQFCARQQIALEALKEKRRKDEQLHKLLLKSESHKTCRRLQLKDLLPAVLQRLTKYPLLFENLYKVTLRVEPDNAVEAEAIQKALECSKKILVDVNHAVKLAEDAHKLQNIQRKLDKSSLDKDEFKNINLTQHRLIHDGHLTMKKNASIQLYGLLFENMIVLLTKQQDDKYALKYLHVMRNTEVHNKPLSPIMNIESDTLVRQEAADKNSFFLIKTKTSQMLELRAPSSSECKTWFKHISEVAEQYKPRSKISVNQQESGEEAVNHLPPHQHVRESSMDMTPVQCSSVYNVPLAPMGGNSSPASSTASIGHDNHRHHGQHMSVQGTGSGEVQLRNPQHRREATPTLPITGDSYHSYCNLQQRFSHNETSTTAHSAAAAAAALPALTTHNGNGVNRTMSTRSCGEANSHGYSNIGEFNVSIGVGLRHTQSARQSNESMASGGVASNLAGGCSGLASTTTIGGGSSSSKSRRSLVHSNNPNNTRTLMQFSLPLVDPVAVHVSVKEAHIAEAVLTPTEKLKRLDADIRESLREKHRIICDMFRLPMEHFHEITDIAAMPEAPKDTSDIALAAYAQIQSLTEIVNEFMRITPEKQPVLENAVSGKFCDRCQSTRQQEEEAQCSVVAPRSPSPPPIPPPKKQMAQAQQQIPAPSVTKRQTCALGEGIIHENDDGYCEIDELRLPVLYPLKKTTITGRLPPPPPPPPPPIPSKSSIQPIGAGYEGKELPPLPSLPQKGAKAVSSTSASDSPQAKTDASKKRETERTEVEEEEEEVTMEAVNEEKEKQKENEKKGDINDSKTEIEEAIDGVKGKEPEGNDSLTERTTTAIETQHQQSLVGVNSAPPSTQSETLCIEDEDSNEKSLEKSHSVQMNPDEEEGRVAMVVETKASDEDNGCNDELIVINENYETLETTPESNTDTVITASGGLMVDSSTQTVLRDALSCWPMAATLIGCEQLVSANTSAGSDNQPGVPCHILCSIVSTLNTQISWLLPKMNQRDVERDRLRKENHHLRQLLNAFHERQRVESQSETPASIQEDNATTTIVDSPAATEILDAPPDNAEKKDEEEGCSSSNNDSANDSTPVTLPKSSAESEAVETDPRPQDEDCLTNRNDNTALHETSEDTVAPLSTPLSTTDDE